MTCICIMLSESYDMLLGPWTGESSTRQERLFGYTDVDWVGSVSNRQSTSSFIFSLKNRAISWSNKKQPTVALSSTKAKYKGAVIATCEAIWFKLLLKDLNESVDKLIRIYYDNQNSIQLARNLVFHAQKKHT